MKWAFLWLKKNALGTTTGIRVIVVVSAMMIRLKQLESTHGIIEMYELLVHYDQRKSRIKVIKEQRNKVYLKIVIFSIMYFLPGWQICRAIL